MPYTALMYAVRHGDLAVVESLLSSGVNVVEVCLVEPAVLRRQESPLYPSHALFEAVRSRNAAVVSALLASPGIDVNQPATSLSLTAFADACSRGDVEMAELLLRDPRCDSGAACSGVAHPALFGAMLGHVGLLKMLAGHGVLGAALEGPLLRTAAANGRGEALRFLQAHFIDSQPFLSLSPGQQVVKVRREFKSLDADGNGYVDRGELEELLGTLGLGLTKEEAQEAFLALNTANDNRITLDQLCAYLLGEKGWKRGLEELKEAGGYAGEQGQ